VVFKAKVGVVGVLLLAASHMQAESGYVVDGLQKFQLACCGSEVMTLGFSEQGRPIYGFRSGCSSGNPVRVAIIAQQHGDETGTVQGALQLMQSLCYQREPRWSKLDILIVPQLNPDGAALATRRNAMDLDLNRHHIDLMPVELRALKRCLAAWSPHVLIDAHEYRPFKADWFNDRILKIWEMQIGVTSSLNAAADIRELSQEELLPSILSGLSKLDVPAAEYHVGDPNLLRRSSTICNSLRQSAAVQGSIAVLLEGRREPVLNANMTRRQWVQENTMALVLDWVFQNNSKIIEACEKARKVCEGDELCLRECWLKADDPLHIKVARCTDNTCDRIEKFSHWRVEEWFPKVGCLMGCSLPKAYHIPKHRADIIALLEEHGIIFSKIATDQIYPKAERFKVLGSVTQQSPPRAILSRSELLQVEKKPILLKAYGGDCIVPIDQPQGKFVACILEPSSDSSIVWSRRFPDLKTQKDYPVTRILSH